MKTSAFFTTAPLTASHGGGNVSVHELAALRRVTDVKQALDGLSILPAALRDVNTLGFNPFMVDYFSMLRLEQPVDLLMFNGACYAVTMHKFLEVQRPRVISDVPAHDLQISVDEHMSMIGKYPYVEQIDPFLNGLMRVHIKKADIVLTPSRYSAEYLKRVEGIPEEKIEVIPHGCNPPETVSDPPEQFTTGSLGSNSPDKGHIYLLHAFVNIIRSDAIRIHMVGGGTISMSTALRDYCVREAMPSPDVITEDRVEDVGDFFNGLSVYIQPSPTEGFGIPVLEAMSFGRPVIVTEGVGAKDLVTDGESGFIIPIRNPDAIAEKIRYFLDNPSEVKRMGQNARAVAEKYSWSWVEEQYEELYTRVLE